MTMESTLHKYFTKLRDDGVLAENGFSDFKIKKTKLPRKLKKKYKKKQTHCFTVSLFQRINKIDITIPIPIK